jgi:hypothetical protein
MAKRKPSTKRSAPAQSSAPTLADVAITWKGADGGVRTVPGAAIARMADFYARRYPVEGFIGIDKLDESLRGFPMLRGLSALMFPDAGAPIAEIDADRRFFLSEALSDLAATMESDRDFSLDLVRQMTVTVAPGLGLRGKDR